MSDLIELKQKLVAETARIHWRELQRFFAQGLVLVVDDSLDLIDVACWIAKDDSTQIKPLQLNKQIMPPSNQQARDWYDDDTALWSVVVAPFVLVQARSELS